MVSDVRLGRAEKIQEAIVVVVFESREKVLEKNFTVARDANDIS